MTVDLVLLNADIRTMDPARPRAKALAVAGSRILALGTDGQMRALLARGGRVLDLGGRTVVPGFTDCHLHFTSYGLSLSRIDLLDTTCMEEALDRIAAHAAKTPKGQWLVGRGWDQNDWPGEAFPTRAALDRVTPDHPTALPHRSGHASWVNTRALEMAGITPDTPDPAGGQIDRGPDGSPTGILKETAIDLVAELADQPSVAEAREAITRATTRAHALGLVGIHDMEGDIAFRAMQELHAAGELRLRVLMQIPRDNLDAALQLGLQSGLGDEFLRIGGVKMFVDGALGPCTAWMLEAYENQPDNLGIGVLEPEQIREDVAKASRGGLAAFVHAIGDRANREVLDAIEAAQAAGLGPGLRHRIEHAQLLHPEDLPRLAQLGVIASMQPIHATQDMHKTDTNWGARRAGAYGFRSLLDSSTALAFGSDSPVESLSVMTGIHAAVTRRRADGSPGPDGWCPAERITVEEAVRAYTSGAAYAGCEENHRGTLSPGKLADLAILSHDIFSIDPMDILSTEVVATIVGGEVVHGMNALAG